MDKIKTIVFKAGNSYLGFSVYEVLDVVSMDDLKTDLAQLDRGIEGHFFLGKNTVALLNPDILLNQVQKAAGRELTPVSGEEQANTAKIARAA